MDGPRLGRGEPLGSSSFPKTRSINHASLCANDSVVSRGQDRQLGRRVACTQNKPKNKRSHGPRCREQNKLILTLAASRHEALVDCVPASCEMLHRAQFAGSFPVPSISATASAACVPRAFGSAEYRAFDGPFLPVFPTQRCLDRSVCVSQAHETRCSTAATTMPRATSRASCFVENGVRFFIPLLRALRLFRFQFGRPTTSTTTQDVRSIKFAGCF